MADAIAAARGRWPEILAALAGLSDKQLSNRHQPCPLCGGTDRYRFDDKDGSGSWFCNQCGGKDQRGGAGSGMDLLMRRQGWSFVEAARQVEAFLGLVPDAKDTSASRGSSRNGKPWRMPEKPPADAPPPTLNRGATAQWAYRNAAGEVLFWIQRIRLRSGGKAFLHRVWLDGAWHRPSRRDCFTCDWPTPRPLYRLPDLLSRPEAPVLVVEGEGTAAAAARLFPGHVVLTWANGSKAIAKADWTPLAGRSVTLWPDADAAGVEAMQSLAALLHPLDCQLQLVALPADLPQGWDLADADWTPRQAARQLAKAAQPWTPSEAGADGSGDGSAPPPAPATAAAAAASNPAAPFLCLGYDADANFYQPSSTGQVIRLPRGCHTATHLVALAPLEYWETLYPSRTGVNWPAAASDLHKSSAAMGIFAVERIRGRGAWWDEGRTVLHLGDRLITPEGEHPITKPFSSGHIYQRLERQEGPCGVKPLTVEEAAVIVSIANRFRWEVPASGTLLQGWVVLVGDAAGAARMLLQRRYRRPACHARVEQLEINLVAPARHHPRARAQRPLRCRQRRQRPVGPHAAADALALEHMDLAEKIAGNFARRTVHPKEDLLQLAMIGLIKAARRRPLTGTIPALWAHLCQWRDHALSAGQRLPAQGAADVAGASCSGAALALLRGKRDGDAGADRDQP